MHNPLRIVCVSAAVVIACSHARAAPKTMPIDFVGDWCFSYQGADKNSTDYRLPSWTEGGHCTDILSIDQYGFYFVPEKTRCEPTKIKLDQHTAQTGTGYTATITARCQPDGPPTAGKIKTFELYRYKGQLSVTR